MKIPRVIKCRLKVSSRQAERCLLDMSKAGTVSYNFSAQMLAENQKLYDEEQERLFQQWRILHPGKAAKYDQKVAKYEQYIEERNRCREEGLPEPNKMHPPRQPRFPSTVKLLTETDISKEWRKIRDDMKVDVNGRLIEIKCLPATQHQGVIMNNVRAQKAAITRRTQGCSASFPQPKPPYADTTVSYSRTNHLTKIEVTDAVNKRGKPYKKHTLLLRTRQLDANGEPKWLRLRFFTKKDFDPNEVGSVKICREKGNHKWFIVLGVMVESSATPLPRRTIGIDINSSEGNHYVVSDPQGEIQRSSLPKTLSELADRVTRLQQEKARILNENGDKYTTRSVRTLKKRIARCHARAANIRRNFLHHRTNAIVKLGDTIALEELDIQKMTKSAKGTKEAPGKNVSRTADKNRKFLRVAPGMFRQMIQNKSDMLDNSKVVAIPSAYTSQTCCICHERGKRHMKMTGKPFECRNPKCSRFGQHVDSDANAATNIAWLAENGKGEIVAKPKQPRYKLMNAGTKKKAEARRLAKAQVVVNEPTETPAIVESETQEAVLAGVTCDATLD